MDGPRLEDITRWGRVPAWWLMHPEMDADRFCVMAALATYMDDEGFCEPSQATLARRLKRSRPWVNRVVAELASAGLLRKTGRRRANGGTTSCRYRLALRPADAVPGEHAEAAIPTMGACPDGDRGRHRRDRNQPSTEQIHHAPAEARARPGEPTNRKGADAEDAGAEGEVPSMPSRDWTPSEEAVAEAARLCPEADLDEHTTLFVSRCRSKGYRFASSGMDDAWLAWLLEDRRKARERAQGRAEDRAARAAAVAAEQAHDRHVPAGGGGASSRHDRFAAWAVAAARRGASAGCDA